MHVSNSASPDAPDARVKRGVAAVQVYLKMQFPDHIIEILKESSDDIARSVRTFSVRNNGQRDVLRVATEVLDLTDGAIVCLRRLQVARTLREAGAGKAVLVTTVEARIESLLTDTGPTAGVVG